MKELGVTEVGDRIAGAPASSANGSWAERTREYRKKNFAEDRPKLQKVYKEWLDRRAR